jgi:hypothetical protein
LRRAWYSNFSRILCDIVYDLGFSIGNDVACNPIADIDRMRHHFFLIRPMRSNDFYGFVIFLQQIDCNCAGI